MSDYDRAGLIGLIKAEFKLDWHGIHGDFYQLTPKQLSDLCNALRHHSGGEVSTNKTIQTCWDADRLDLGRVGIFPSPQFLSQEANIFIDLAYDWSTQAPRRTHV